MQTPVRRAVADVARCALVFAMAFPCLAAGQGVAAASVAPLHPSAPLVSSPVSATIGPAGSDRHVFTVEAAEGDVISLSLFADVAEGDLDLSLYALGTVDLAPNVPSSARSNHRYVYPEVVEYLVPPGGSGTFRVVVSVFQPLRAAMDYTLEWRVARPFVHRLSGSDRYATSMAVSASTFTTSSVAVLATGADFPDALAASALAGTLDAPLLLVRDNVESDAFGSLERELVRLGRDARGAPFVLYLIGGPGVISIETERYLRETLGYVVTRVAGRNRYETAHAVAQKVRNVRIAKGESVGEVFLARGDGFADALSAAPYAYAREIPVLLTGPGHLHTAAASFIEDRDILDVTVVGGEAAISPGVENAVSALNGGATETYRVGGANRHVTSVMLAEHAVVARGWARWAHVGIATGGAFPDALSGAVAVGRRKGALVLTLPTVLPAEVQASLASRVAAIDMVMIFGGTAAVGGGVAEQVAGLAP